MALALVFFAVLHLTSFSQKNNAANWQTYAGEALRSNIHQADLLPRKGNTRPPNRWTAVPQLLQPSSLQDFLYARQLPIHSGGTHLPGRDLPQPGSSCTDTSFVQLLHMNSSWIYVQKMATTADDGTLILGLIYDTTQPNFIKRGEGLVIKTDDLGKVSWIKEFYNTDPNAFSTFFMYNAFELSNQDILCVGSVDTTAGFNASNTIVYRLDKNGQIIWQKGLHTDLANTYPQISININSVAEGLNGDLILCGTTESNGNAEMAETIIRLDASGNIVWDANYRNTSSSTEGAEGISVFLQGSQITEVGISHGADAPFVPAAINVLTLDYVTGNLLNKRFFRPDYTDPNEALNKSFTYYYNQCVRLTNGHYLVGGKLYSDFIGASAVIDHFGLIEFDGGFNVVKSFTISSSVHTNYYSNDLYLDNYGRGLVSLFHYMDPLNANLFLGSFQNEQFLHQRELPYTNIALTDPGNFRYTSDNGYIFAQSYFQGGYNSFIEFRKMHNSDTSSLCLGTQTFILQFSPLQFIEDPLYAYLGSAIDNKVSPVAYQFLEDDTSALIASNPCAQLNSCDSLKISGSSFCGNSAAVLFTAYKNPGCGGIVQWTIDSAAIDSLLPQNDSTALIHLKDTNWKGHLIASLPKGKCSEAVDSIRVTIMKRIPPLNLGPDTVLCRGNKRVLHAGIGYASYRWQDGAGDSLYTVSAPGKYYVTVKDECGNAFSDTIRITGADFSFSGGNDTTVCNKIPVVLTASAGFVNYQWQPNYDISSDTGRSVTILPATDTTYSVTADKWPGCSFSDTIRVRVLASPIVDLGPDRGLCSNQFITLDAGAGFASYLWNNGAATRQIIVNHPGTWFVKATATNGCGSSDTVQILSIGPPANILGDDTTLCQDTVYRFSLQLPGATYLWSDGSTSGNFSIRHPGRYSVIITQQGCLVKDTITVRYKDNPTVDLGNDTTICSGFTYLLNAAGNQSSYLWQDGSTQPYFLVSAPGRYFVTVNLDGCVARDSVDINYLNKPGFTLGNDTTICHGETITLQPVVNGPANYLWQDGSSQSTFLVTDTGVFTLRVANTCGSLSSQISVKQGLCDLMLPSAFTPNGDGVNDIFRIRYPFRVKSFRLAVYNRLGQKIFETADMTKGWDGTYHGLPQPADVYVWVASLVRLNNTTQASRGIITLLR